jgi:hypothetical protein
MAAVYNREATYRGDTLLGWSVQVDIDGAPAPLASARLQLRAANGSLVHDWAPGVVGSNVTFPTVPAETTAQWPVGRLEFDLEITLLDGRVATWLTGSQLVNADRTR